MASASASATAGKSAHLYAAAFVRTNAVSSKAAVEPTVTVIASADELAAYAEANAGKFDLENGWGGVSFTEAAASYGGAFFTDSVLLPAFFEAPSGGIRHEASILYSTGGEHTLIARRIIPEAATLDMAGRHMFAERSRDVRRQPGEPQSVSLSFETVDENPPYDCIPDA